MPAYRERIYICPAESGQPGWIVEFPFWWNRAEFFEKYRARGIDTGNPFYVDFGYLLSGSEARAWDEICREKFAEDARSKEPFFIDAERRMESLLRTASWVIIESYEWESGLS